MNDWYGFGVIDVIIGEGITHGWQFCGRRACRDQYRMGQRHGIQIIREGYAEGSGAVPTRESVRVAGAQ